MQMSYYRKSDVSLYKVVLTEVPSSLPMVAAILNYMRRGWFQLVIASLKHVFNANALTEIFF